MPSFSKTSKERLVTCHRDIQTIFNEVIQTIDCSILCGHRKEEDQNQAFDDGLSQLRYPDSKHNIYPSMAVDVAPYFPDLKNTDWEDAKAFALFAGRVIEISWQLYRKGLTTHVLRWGGDWDSDGRTSDQTFHDLPHFELVRP